MKKILILFPKNVKVSQPSYERVAAFSRYFTNTGVDVIECEQPNTLKEKLDFIKLIKTHNIRNIFISMPQCMNWWIFLLGNTNVILDIRDGWSISMQSGYGGTAKPNKLKAWLASKIEYFAIKRAVLTITCTPGLQQYLQTLSLKKIALILNGYSEEDKKIVNKLRAKKLHLKNSNINNLRAICVGQFSEYGKEKVKIVLKKLSEKYKDKKVILSLIGSNKDSNNWIKDFIVENDLSNLQFEILFRMNKREMYKQILNSDISIAIIRDPNYDFGTKVFDYLLCEKPIFNYFESSNNFVESFFYNDDFMKLIKKSRNEKISIMKNELMKALR